MMKLFRYRKPSINTLLGLTKSKRRAKKALGIYTITKITNAPQNFKRRMLRRAGYYSTPMKILRNGAPKIGGGCLVAAFTYLGLFMLLVFVIRDVMK